MTQKIKQDNYLAKKTRDMVVVVLSLEFGIMTKCHIFHHLLIHFCHLLYGDATTTTTIIHQYNHNHPPMTVSIAIAAPVSPSFV